MDRDTEHPGRLAGKVALITGAGSGLGRECALLFAREGAAVVVTDVNAARADAVAATIGEQGGRATARTVDVRSEAQLESAMGDAVDVFGSLNVVHANAGIGVRGSGSVPFEEITEADWDQVNDVNFKGVFLTIKQAARVLKHQGTGGSIVATSSAASLLAYPGMSAYAAGKAGVNGLVRSAAFDLGKHGIRVNATLPTHGMSVNFALPPDATVLGQSWEEAALGDASWGPSSGPMPLKLPVPPTLLDNAYPVLFLASDEAKYLSGVCLSTADGGTMSRTPIQFPENWSLDERTAALS
jgi:NAD(P)-dependent dehydrogenase (short-subunit alcohol dehydrogenase family)